MQYSVDYRKQDLEHGFNLMFKSQSDRGILLGMVVVVLLLFVLGFGIEDPRIKGFLVKIVLPGMGLIVLLMGFVFLLRKAQVKSLMEGSRFFSEISHWTFLPESVVVRWPSGEMDLSWSYFLGHTHSDRMILLWATPQQAHMFPLHGLPEPEVSALVDLVGGKTRSYRQTGGAGPPKKVRRLFLTLLALAAVLTALLLFLQALIPKQEINYLPRAKVATIPWVADYDEQAATVNLSQIPDSSLDYALFALVDRRIYPHSGDDGLGFERLNDLPEGYQWVYWTLITEAVIANHGMADLIQNYGSGTIREIAGYYRIFGVPEVAVLLEDAFNEEEQRPALADAFRQLGSTAATARIRFVRENPDAFPALKP